MGSIDKENETTELSKKYEELEGTGPEPYAAFQALKDKIKLHYDIASDYYLSLWGEHIHHGYFTDPTQSKEQAQTALIDLLLKISHAIPDPVPANTKPESPAKILDVGCGVGGTSRYLATNYGAQVTGITISSKQVEIARRLAFNNCTYLPSDTPQAKAEMDWISIGFRGGQVRFWTLDAEKMGEHFGALTGSPSTVGFDVVWISEALSHFPNKPLFFQNSMQVLCVGGKLVLADWFKEEGLTEKQFADDIKPIEDGMLLPPLCTQQDYVEMAERAGLKVVGSGPMDISKEVAKTWDISWSLVQNPSLWAFAFSQGRDGIAFLQAFRAMRRGYANGTFRYAVMAFEKVGNS